MSRIGKKSIEIPEKVKLAVSDTGSIKVEGPKGKLEWILPGSIKLRVDGKPSWTGLRRPGRSRRCTACHAV
jgi:large subunit ribosomal protein L6